MKGIGLNRANGLDYAWRAVLAAVLLVFVVGSPQSRSIAQDDPGTETKAPSWGDDNKSAAQPKQSFVPWMIHSSGIFGFVILLVSFVMMWIIMAIGLRLRRDNYLPLSFIEQFKQRLLAKDYDGAYAEAKGSDSLIGRILAEGMTRLPRGFDEAEAGMQEVGENETMAMEHMIGYLSLIGSIAPMLGLLGTVQGMVVSFQAIANPMTSPNPSDLFDGIATALFTTLEGLVVAIPAIVFYTLFKNRLSRFLMECGFTATDLMSDFRNMTKASAHPGGGAGVANAPAGPRAE